jgi:hypothetical protein
MKVGDLKAIMQDITSSAHFLLSVGRLPLAFHEKRCSSAQPLYRRYHADKAA